MGKGKRPMEPEGPPDEIEELGDVVRSCENELVVKSTNQRVPMFNARIFLENKEEIGKIDEIFGPINAVCFSVKPAEGIDANSMVAKAGKPLKKVYIDCAKMLPMARFLPNAPIAKDGKGKGKGKGGGGDFAGRGGGGGRGRGA